MQRPPLPAPRGILKPQQAIERFQLSRIAPSPSLAAWIENYWIVRWDLRDQPAYTQAILPHPSVNIAIEAQKSRITGIVRRKFTYQLQGQGMVFGAKFWPGMFSSLWQTPVAELTDREIPLAQKFGDTAAALEAQLLGAASEDEQVDAMEHFLQAHLPPTPPAQALAVREMVAWLDQHSEILRVDDLAAHTGHSVRTLQRLFRQHVGTSPKWVIQRYRLLEAAERLAQQPDSDLCQLALDLQYFDQAHFIKDFKAILGHTPRAYVRELAS